MEAPIALSFALTAAVETGLVAALLTAPDDAEGLARAHSLDPRATARVLDLLVAHDLLVRDGDRYAMGDALRQWLARAPGGPSAALAMWSNVPAFLRTGAPFMRTDERRDLYAGIVPALGRIFAPIARELAEELAAKLTAPSRVLDIGCGSGVWSLALAQRHPHARITGLDLPAVLGAFHARASELGVADRIATLPGDVHATEIPRAFDLAIVANVLRIESPARAQEIVRRAAAAIVPGGAVVIVDAFAGGTPERERARTAYALNLAMRTAQGRVYTIAEVTGWLQEAGLAHVTPIELSIAPSGALLARS